MIREWHLPRNPTDASGTTFGELYDENSNVLADTLEDAIREVPGEPVSAWKVQNETAIPARRYKITLEDSPRFGVDTLTVNNVEGFSGVRMHSGDNKDDTDGCIILGDVIDGEHIHGGKLAGIVDLVKGHVKSAIAAGDEVWLTISNPTT